MRRSGNLDRSSMHWLQLLKINGMLPYLSLFLITRTGEQHGGPKPSGWLHAPRHTIKRRLNPRPVFSALDVVHARRTLIRPPPVNRQNLADKAIPRSPEPSGRRRTSGKLRFPVFFFPVTPEKHDCPDLISPKCGFGRHLHSKHLSSLYRPNRSIVDGAF